MFESLRLLMKKNRGGAWLKTVTVIGQNKPKIKKKKREKGRTVMPYEMKLTMIDQLKQKKIK